jgi:hypothetical protein
MNVKNDLTNVQGGTVASRARGGAKAAAVRAGATGEASLQGAVRPGEQTIAGAFSMIQKAQSIVQQALAVSSRLRNIAPKP